MGVEWLVLFDIDGTLLHSGGCGRAATRLAVQDVFGTTGQLDEVSFAGTTDWQVVLEALVPAGFVAEEIRRDLDRYERAVAGHLAQIIAEFPLRPCPGAPCLPPASAITECTPVSGTSITRASIQWCPRKPKSRKTGT